MASGTPSVQYGHSDPSTGSLMTSMTYPNGRILHYAYASGLDAAIGRLTSLNDDNGSGGVGTALEAYAYLGLATIAQRTDGDGVALSYIEQAGDTLAGGDGGDPYTGLDRFGRVIDQNWVNTSTGVSTDRFQYGYDADGNVLYKDNLVDSNLSELYHANAASNGDDSAAYDALDRLTGFRRGTLTASGNNTFDNLGEVSSFDTVTTGDLSSLGPSSESYTMDALGNFSSVTTDGTSASRTTNKQNEVTSALGESLGYDGNGNMTNDPADDTLVYDAWNRLAARKSGSTTVAAYTYDGQGRRITEAYSSGTTDLYYTNQWQVIEERADGTTTTSIQYVWSGDGYVDDLVLRDRDADAGGSTGSYGKSASGLEERLYAQQDANHNVTALVNMSSGSVVERYVYDPYGNVTVLTAAGSLRGSGAASASSFAWRYLHQGGRLDLNSGLYYFRNRDYSPTLERWVEQDPAGYTGSPSLYAYLMDGPASSTDSLGLFLDEGEDPNWNGWGLPDEPPAPPQIVDGSMGGIDQFVNGNGVPVNMGPDMLGVIAASQPFGGLANSVESRLLSKALQNFSCCGNPQASASEHGSAGPKGIPTGLDPSWLSPTFDFLGHNVGVNWDASVTVVSTGTSSSGCCTYTAHFTAVFHVDKDYTFNGPNKGVAGWVFRGHGDEYHAFGNIPFDRFINGSKCD